MVAPAETLVVRVADGTIGGGLRNTGDLVRLVDPSGEERDALSYGDRRDVFDPPLAAPGAGESLAARSASAESGSENWAIAARPTPGEANRFPPPPVADRLDAAAPAVTVVSDSGRSAVPWIVLTVTATAGLGGVGALASRHLPARIRKRKNA